MKRLQGEIKPGERNKGSNYLMKYNISFIWRPQIATKTDPRKRIMRETERRKGRGI